jgi:predicted GIY-YIG superfamily endonuclease
MRELIRHIIREYKKDTLEDFIIKANEIHGDKYDYSKTNYINRRTKIKIICPIHGEFEQNPGHHLNGSGCPKCGVTREPSKWTEDELRKEASKYEVYSDFINLSPSAYQIAKKKKSPEFLEDITKHMIKTTRWTDDALENEATKYKTRGEFQKNSPVAYTTALRRGILDDICSHMERAGSKYLRYIYAYEFPDNSVYVGLTYNLDERHRAHMNSPTSSVNLHIQTTGLKPIRKTVSELLDSQEASKVETRILDEYEKKGWTVLNRAKTGVLGGSTLFWTEDKIIDEIKKYKTLNEFYINAPSAFNALRKLGKEKFNLLTKNLKRVKEKLSDEEIGIIAGMYDNKMTFFKEEPRAYSQAKRKGQDFFNKVTSHMKNQKTYWTDEMLRNESLKYSSRNAFAKGSPSAYTTARRRGLLDSFFPKDKK